MHKNFLILFAGLIIFLNTVQSNAQNDCCGFGNIFSSLLSSGIFGGYGFQQYSAEGLNNYVTEFMESENVAYEDFGFAHGWLIGANLIQFRQEDIMIGFKFYYQSLTESQQADGTYQGEDATQELDLKINSWGLGLSMSYILNKNFDIRVFDAYMTFPSVSFKNQIRTTSDTYTDEYESSSANIGFAADAGLVFYPAPPYISIEVIGGYSFFSVETMQLKDGGGDLNTTSDFIDAGGFYASAVLTVGIPFD
jgi:hypothetical protein